MKRLLLSGLIILAVLSCGEAPWPTSEGAPVLQSVTPVETFEVLWGPVELVRTDGAPNVFTLPISSDDFEHFEGPFVLYVQNGNPDGSGRVEGGAALELISSATIVLDSTQIFGRSDFSQQVSILSAEVSVTEGSQLVVNLASKPGSGLFLWIEGKLKPGRARLGTEGGAVQSEDGKATIVVPSGALAEPVIFALEPAETDVPSESDLAKRLADVYELGPSGVSFSEPVELTLTLAPGVLAEMEDPSAVEVYELRQDLGALLRLPTVVDVDAGTVSAGLRHFSQYTVISSGRLQDRGMYPVEVLNAPTRLDPEGNVATAVGRAVMAWQDEVGRVGSDGYTFDVLYLTHPGDEYSLPSIGISWVPFTDGTDYGRSGFDWRLNRRRIYLNDARQWYAGAKVRAGSAPLPSTSVEATVLHEFGHVLGLTHTRPCDSAPYDDSCYAPPVMAPLPEKTGTVDLVTLHPSDIERIRLEYEIPNPPDPAPAAITNRFRNLFGEIGYTEEETTAKINLAYQEIFEGALYHYDGAHQWAYVIDSEHQNVRSEGMSYGMMIAAQLNKDTVFDALWKWAKENMYVSDPASPYYGFFSWKVAPDGRRIEPWPAPDGEEYFAMALYFASGRWGNSGTYNYRAEADQLVHNMRNRQQIGVGGPLFHPTEGMVLFSSKPSDGEVTDPSYHLPHFYELWSLWGPEADRVFWAAAAARSRAFFHGAAHATTGLTPDRSDFSGTPQEGPEDPDQPNGRSHMDFGFDAWRSAANWSVDWSWWREDEGQRELSDRIQAFFDREGIDQYGHIYTLDGTKAAGADGRSPGLVAMNAVAGLAATNYGRALRFADALWKIRLEDVEQSNPYYDGLLYLLGLMHVGAQFKTWVPQAPVDDGVPGVDIMPTAQGLAPGGTSQVPVEVRDASGRIVPNPTINWHSSNPFIATVSTSGQVRALVVGTATITATSGGYSDQLVIQVNPQQVGTVCRPADATFTDSFSGTSLGSAWTVVSGAWTVANGYLTGYWSEGSAWTDHANLLLADDRYPATGNWTAVSTLSSTRHRVGFGLYNSAGNWYSVEFNNGAAPNQSLVVLRRYNDYPYGGVNVLLAEDRGDLFSNTRSGSLDTVAVRKTGSRIEGFVNGWKVLETIDPYYNGNVRLGYHVYGTIRPDDFAVCAQ